MPNIENNFNNNDFNIISPDGNDTAVTFTGDTHYIRLTVLNVIGNIVKLGDGSDAVFYASEATSSFDIQTPGKVGDVSTINIGTEGTYPNDFVIYRDTSDNIYLKPNEILAEKLIPEGNYTIQVDFLNQFSTPDDNLIIKQISPSRKEVRLKLLDSDISVAIPPDVPESPIIAGLESQLTDNYNHVLYVGGGVNIPIVNHLFDTSKDGETNQSIILKLYEPLPTNITTLTLVTIEEEVLVTQTEEVFYFSDIPPVSVGGSLTRDDSFDYGGSGYDANEDFQNYDDLSGSLSSQTLNSIFTGSSYDYPNLNVNYNEFENHTFFGSAVKKLENFKTKVIQIENYYSDIDSSLSADGGAIDGDSTYLKKHRSSLFDKIQLEIDGFTPYERFLYFDGQSQTTSSAPSLGDNYADVHPMSNTATNNTDSWNNDGIVAGHNPNGEELTNHDGFNIVYKNTDIGISAGEVGLFQGKYFAHEKPFFNYSGSVYISFLLKGTTDVNVLTHGVNFSHNKTTTRNGLGVPIPLDAHYSTDIEDPDVVADEYRRYIFQASQSYWIPNKGSEPKDFSVLANDDFPTDSDTVTILHTNVKTSSYQIQDSTGKYPTTVVTQSGVPFYGACMPAGDLFQIRYSSGGSGNRKAYVTDVKVTLNDPTDTLPFSNTYTTGSTNWTTWYDSIHSSAVSFDETNIHSLENNLPTYIQQSSDYDDLKKFLSMNGEHFDLIRNHIDGMGTIYNRNYKKQDSVPSNLLPILLDNMGWDSINPFTGSLSTYFSNSLTSTTSVKDVSENTWRKSLNNLIYLYKSKGTKNSVRALLNIYGYPPDVLGINEYGGSNEEQNPATITNNFDPLPQGLSRTSGNVSYILNKQKLHNYIFNTKSDRTLNLDWWMNDANVETVEFIYKHKDSTTDQEILKSSGSGTETLWDLRVQESASLYNFEFRLNNSYTGSSAIASNAISMSTSYSSIGGGSLWNVMLQRMSSSISGSGTQGYKLAAAFQDKDKITILNATSMSVSGGLTRDANYNVNENWQSSGSRHYLSSSNLIVGRTLSGSLAEFRTWTTTLSASKFKQHTLNKFSTVGNSISSHKDELIYHFKLNENYNSGSLTGSTVVTIKDANPKKIRDYSFTKSSDIVTGSIIYGYDIIDTYSIGTQDSNQSTVNSKQIIIDPEISLISNLNPYSSAINNLSSNSTRRAKRTNSYKLDINRSPQNYINNFILDKIQGFNLEDLYSNPPDKYDTNYSELDTFRETFFDNYEVLADINKFIRAQENIFNESLITSIKKLVPARSKMSPVGVTIKPTILERQKYKNKKHSVEVNPNTVTDTIEVTKRTDYKSGFSSIGSYEKTRDGLLNISINETGIYEKTKDGTLNLNNLISETADYEKSKDGILNINNLISKTATYEKSKDVTLNINNLIVESATYKKTKDGTMSMTPSLEASKQTSHLGTSTYLRDKNYESFRDLHAEWGRGIDDTYFINHHITGGAESNNVAHIDSRYHFYAIGDTEVYSGSIGKESDFSDHRRFYNRQNITEGVFGDSVYESYINGNPGTQTGRAMGKTRYFFTSSNGDIVLPSNHVRKFSQPFKNQMYKGTQNTNPGFTQQPNQKYEDLSSASFYRVKVTGGTNELYVRNNRKPRKDDEDRIIY